MNRQVIIKLDDLRQIIQHNTKYVLNNTNTKNTSDVISILCNHIELDILTYEIT